MIPILKQYLSDRLQRERVNVNIEEQTENQEIDIEEFQHEDEPTLGN